jgi:aminoglycoside phosphotransferase family enzyme/predicted kinase
LIVDDPLVRDLLRPDNLPEPAERFVSTHASYVFLTRRFVFKIKRAKDYGFFDYSTLDKRRFFCEAEVRLNRRTAPDVYLDVLPVYRDDRGYSLTRPGPVADYAVHMIRLDDAQSALSMLQRGALEHGTLDDIARRVSDFFRGAATVGNTADAVRWILRENFKQVEPYVGRFVPDRQFQETRAAQEAWLASRDADLRRRAAKDGHGDLRLEHVYLRPSGPTLIDCIEFSDTFRHLDPALDAAFFAMELAFYGRPDLAEYFVAKFAYELDDYDLYPLIDGYLSYRAWVRGKVACFLAADPKVDAATAEAKAREAGAFFDLSHRTITRSPAKPRIIAVGGVIGTGKSTVAQALSKHASIPIVNADATRKFMAGLGHETAGPPSLYTSDVTQRVYEELLRRAGAVLSSGRSVILDATYRSKELRSKARAFALSRGADFRFIECRVADELARSRLRARTGGVSDAREELYDSFKAGFEPVTELSAGEYAIVDTSRPVDPANLLPAP